MNSIQKSHCNAQIQDISLSGNGCCYEYSKEGVNRIDIVKNGVKKGYQLIGDKLKEYDADGRLKYEGEFEGCVEDGFVWNGMGTEYLPSGLIVNGEFRKGKRVKIISEINGEKMTEYDDNNRIVYIEEYSKEKMCGLYENGEKKYEGEMKNGLPNGHGVYYDRSGSVMYEGEWKDGRIDLNKGVMFDYRKEMCLLLNCNGEVFYEGELKDGVAHGKGRIVNKQGKMIFSGEFKNGTLELGNTDYIEIECGKVMIYERSTGLFGCGSKMKMREWDGNRIEIKMTVRRRNDIRQLSKLVSELVIAEDVCNDMENDLVISRFDNLRSIVVKKNAMKNLNSLKICDCAVLEKFVVEDGEWGKGAFWDVKSVELTSK